MSANERPNRIASSRRCLDALDWLGQYLRFGARTLTKNPAYTCGVILTLAIGIAGVTAMFSIVHGVLLKPLPYPEADRLVAIWDDDEQYYGRSWPTAADVQALKEAARAFERVGVYREGTHLLEADDGIESEYIRSASVDADMLPVLNPALFPQLGREFVADEYRPEPFTAILTHEFWQRRFGGDPEILGKTLQLSAGAERSSTVTVVGVLPEDFRFHAISAAGAAVFPWKPHILLPLAPGVRGQPVGRLSAGVSLDAAQAELDRFTAALRAEYPAEGPRGYRAVPLKSELISDARSTVLLYFGAVMFVLLIAVANLASLQLARAVGRKAEIAQRLVIGSSPLRLVGMFVTESLILALAGAAAGVVLAKLALGWLLSGLPAWPRVEESGIEGLVVVFAATVAMAIGVLFGLAPASLAYRTNLTRALHEGARGQAEGAAPLRFRKMLIAGEVALAVVLLSGAGLIGQSFLNLVNQDPGMDPRNLLYAAVRMDRPSASRSEGVQRYEALVGRLEQYPVVASASYAVVGFFGAGPVTVEQTMEPREPFSVYSAVAPDYFRTLGVPIVKGRVFDERASGEVVIRESMARQFWPGLDPIGQRFVLDTAGPDNPWLTVVGVVPDFKTAPSAPVEAVAGSIALDPVYGLCDQAPGGADSACNDANLVVRTRADPADAIDLVRAEIAALDGARLTSIRTSDQMYDSALAAPQFRTVLFGIFASVALLLTFVGVYGVTAYTATHRMREVGVRIVLGATRAEVMRMLLKQAFVPVLLGAAVGLFAASAATRLLRAYLFEVEPSDPMILSAILATIAATALLASFMPSLRASMSDPTTALRSD